MLRIWGRTNSVNVQKVLFAAEHLGLSYERIDAGGPFGVNDTPEYRAMNPNGLVPTIDDGGLIVWESGAIVRYFCAKHAAGTLWPDDPAARTRADRWADWQSQFGRAMGPAFLNLVRTPPDKRDTAAVETSRAAAETEMATLDGHLATSTFLAGDRLTFADFIVGPLAHRWLNLPLSRHPRPHVERWHRHLSGERGAAAAFLLPLT